MAGGKESLLTLFKGHTVYNGFVNMMTLDAFTAMMYFVLIFF